MNKKWLCIILCLFLLMSMPLSAFAEGTILGRTPAIWYRTGNALCVFFDQASGEARPQVIAKTSRFASYAVPTTYVRDGQTPVTYIILLDATWRTSQFRSQVKQLVGDLMNNNYASSRMILYPFNRNGVMEKHVTDTGITTAPTISVKAIQDAIDKINYMGQDISSAPVTAGILEWLFTGDYPVDTGGIVNVITVSSRMSKIQDDETSYNRIWTLLGSTPQLLFHTVQIGKPSAGYPYFGRGIYTETTDDASASMAAKSIKDYMGALERVLIPWGTDTADRLDMMLYLKPTEKNSDGTEQMASAITIQSVPRIIPARDMDVVFTVED